MAKKTFIEEELERERRLRGESTRKRAKDSVGTRHAERAQAIVAAKEADRIGLFLTPNEARMQYSYPTISDEPQTVILPNSFAECGSSAQQASASMTQLSQALASENLYVTAIRAMRNYGKGV